MSAGSRYIPIIEGRATFEGRQGPELDSAREAWRWLADRRRDSEDAYPDWHVGEYTETLRELDYAATSLEFGNPCEDTPLNLDGTGAIVGDTPGVGDGHYCDPSDPGVKYLVTKR